jgi:hypothetical protein
MLYSLCCVIAMFGIRNVRLAFVLVHTEVANVLEIQGVNQSNP